MPYLFMLFISLALTYILFYSSIRCGEIKSDQNQNQIEILSLFLFVFINKGE